MNASFRSDYIISRHTFYENEYHALSQLDFFLNDKINDKINDLDKTILGEIRKNKYITIPELSKKIGKSEPTIYRHIEGLMKKDILTRMESRKTGYWEIIE